MKYRFFFLIIVFVWITRCDLFNQCGDGTSFFPLQVGRKWHYRTVKSDFDIDKENFFFPKEFTVEVSQQKTIGGIRYYEVKNYFLPGPSLPQPAYMRHEGGRIFVLVNDKEYLLYSFDSADSSSWHLPMYVNPTDLFNYYAERIELNPHEANFSWSYIPTLEDSEGYWYEIFQKGIGRTKILSFTQLYGNVDWELLP